VDLIPRDNRPDIPVGEQQPIEEGEVIHCQDIRVFIRYNSLEPGALQEPGEMLVVAGSDLHCVEPQLLHKRPAAVPNQGEENRLEFSLLLGL